MKLQSSCTSDEDYVDKVVSIIENHVVEFVHSGMGG
jgi:hypothetical protein